jgi:ATP-binding cassette, subfamily B, bacterial
LWDLSWPVDRAGAAIQALALYARVPHRVAQLPQAPTSVLEEQPHACHTWIESTAAYAGLHVELKPGTYASLPDLVGCGLSLLQMNFEGNPRLLAIVSLGRGKLLIIPPQLAPVRTRVENLRSAIARSLEAHVESSMGGILDEAGITGMSRSRALQSMLDERLGGVWVADVWKVEPPASAGIWTHFRLAGLPRMVVGFLTAYGLEYGLWIFSWILVGRWALGGRIDTGWLLCWALLLLTLVPAHLLAMWQQAKISIFGAWFVMRHLLEGSFKLRPEEVRYTGIGQHLARVLDAEALQSLALTGSLSGAVALLEMAVGAVLLATCADAPWIALLLVAWMGLTIGLGLVYHRRRRTWTGARLDATQELIERMTGHRTRLAQQPPESWHDGEDEPLANYEQQSRRMDWISTICLGMLPQAWLVAGVAVMARGVLNGSQSAGLLAAQLGLILLGYTSLQRLNLALANLSGAVIAAERVRDLLQAARRVEPAGDPAIAVAADGPVAGNLLEMRDITFRYPRRAANAVCHASAKINKGDRILLQGDSGSGKSTCVALVSGLRQADSGLLFLHGIDRKTLGDRGWRRHVVASPQFHENHILSGSLAFNLLLGRRWPPEPQDLDEAEAICRELGLGSLLEHMPGGLMQMVGETGWQLSNGEKNRVYLARALLQGADLVVLDETFAALDPETTQQAMDCVLRRAPTLLCVAHL